MAGILDEGYGVKDARKERIRRRAVLGTLAVVLAGTFLYFYFRTWPQERVMQQFLAALERKDFQGAYKMFGCSQDAPCPNYEPERFNRDFGPDTPYWHGAAAQVLNVDYCDDVVVFNVAYPNADPLPLWVVRSTNTVGFAPWPRCPGRHWEFKKFFRSLFSMTPEVGPRHDWQG